ncbi:MAG: hypothetical protein ABSD88_00010 [Candidatus Korobacteraceae bacterium]|jgi:hypothetical protein
MRRPVSLLALVLAGSCWLAGATLQLPEQVTAGQGFSVQTSGSGSSTLYLFGPAAASKHKVKLGTAVEIEGNEVAAAGRYALVLDGASTSFFVSPGPVSSLAFIARPSRVPAAKQDVVSGTAFLLDRNQNLVLSPQTVTFTLTVPGAPDVQRTEQSRGGVAWTRLDSSRRAGAAQFVARAGDASVRRVVQEVAGEPCNIRMSAQRGNGGTILVQTDPIHDCAGNPVPDGTIVTFTSVDGSGRNTVDARIKRGIAQAELPGSASASISVAAGVVVGNEIHWGGGR